MKGYLLGMSLGQLLSLVLAFVVGAGILLFLIGWANKLTGG